MKCNYICPACDFFKLKTPLSKGNICICDVCTEKLTKETNPSIIKLLKAFSKHKSNGYRCPACKKFMPDTMNGIDDIICPYPDCLFIGKIDELERMRHPSIKKIINKISVKNTFTNVNEILNVIKQQENIAIYSSSSSILPLKKCIFEAFTSFAQKFPNEMYEYLFCGKRGFDIQSKLFQEYVSILESKLPISIKKRNKLILVNSILDKEITPFIGLSKFSSIVDNNGFIKNNTEEMYIGGRKSYYCHPCYIGKVIDILDTNGNSLKKNILWYSFSRIKTDLPSKTNVLVSHLRIPAHYQMGILSHINRIKKQLRENLND